MRRRPLLVAATLAAAALPYAVATTQSVAAPPKYDVTITRTEYGIPHIKGANFGSAGYGFGYAFAQDNLCVMAEGYVTVRGERSRFFGADGSYLQGGNGVAPNNLNSDVFWQQVKDSGVVEDLVAAAPPYGPEPGVKEAVAGYVDGYNRYLADVGGANGITDPNCKGQPWVRPISTQDAYLRFYQLILLASQDVIIDGIAEAAPPAPGAPTGTTAALDNKATARLLGERWQRAMGALGSNAVAIGKAGSRDKKHGVLLGNPHFPWSGTERFYQAHVTIPGVLDVSGAALFGVPMVLIGHTASMAWSHTVSTAYRFTPYQLTLVPGQPTQYLQDGQPTPMEERTVTVQVKDGDGLKPVTRSVWWTRYGPVFNNILGIPLPWTPATAFVMRDANADNFRIFNHFLATAKAQSAPEMLTILKKYQGIPWVNTIVADRAGNALYADIGVIPHVTDAKARRCNTALGAATFQLLGLPVLDGSRTNCDWGSDPDSARPGLFGASSMPHLMRSDYVTNSNDSYWLANPHQPLEGFSRIIGTEDTARTLRTRSGLVMTQKRVNGTDGLGPAGFTRQDMQDMVFRNDSYAGQLLRNDLVELCRSAKTLRGGVLPTTGGVQVEIGNACKVLATWDRKENLDSRGGVLFRRFFRHVSASPAPVGSGNPFWARQYDSSDPVHTPTGLRKASPQAWTALGDAIKDMRGADVELDAPLGEQQYVVKNGVRYPIHGGIGDPEGQFNAIWAGWSSENGVTSPDGGTSFVQAVTWNNGPCPDARTILTYSLSTDPTSPHYADQTALYSQKKWVRARFCAADIAASPVKQVTHLTG